MRWLGKILRWIIFPWGTSFKKPRDILTHKIVSAMLEPSEFRDRLTQYCFVAKAEHEPMRKLENALARIQKIEPILKKFDSERNFKYTVTY